MPLYDYRCETCGYFGEFMTRMSDLQSCPKCRAVMKRVPHARFGISMGAVGAYGYYDETLQKHISTNRQRREEMAAQGVTEKGATPKNGQTWV